VTQNCILHHPAIAHAGQRLVDAKRDHVALLVGAARIVVALIHPGGDERAILADDDAVVDHCGIVEQVGQAGIPGPVLFQV
jgi:hypothetical protein